MSAAVAPRLHLATFDPTSSEAYQLLLRRPMNTLPNPRTRVTNVKLRLRGHGQPITVAFLGHQRGEKGYHLVPEILAQLEHRFASDHVRFLVHNGEPQQMKDVQAKLHPPVRRGLPALRRSTNAAPMAASGRRYSTARISYRLHQYFPRRFSPFLIPLSPAMRWPMASPSSARRAPRSKLSRQGFWHRRRSSRSGRPTPSCAPSSACSFSSTNTPRAPWPGRSNGRAQQGPAHCVDAILRLAGQ